jgi:hypothetical protein
LLQLGEKCAEQHVPPVPPPHVPHPSESTSPTQIESHCVLQQYESLAHTHELTTGLEQLGVE